MGEGIAVGAIMAVNAAGSIVDSATAELVAGPRFQNGLKMADTSKILVEIGSSVEGGLVGQNTTIDVVTTNAKLDKEAVNKLASVAHDGIALSVRPAHTMSDGDAMFALATGRVGVRGRHVQAL